MDLDSTRRESSSTSQETTQHATKGSYSCDQQSTFPNTNCKSAYVIRTQTFRTYDSALGFVHGRPPKLCTRFGFYASQIRPLLWLLIAASHVWLAELRQLHPDGASFRSHHPSYGWKRQNLGSAANGQTAQRGLSEKKSSSSHPTFFLLLVVLKAGTTACILTVGSPTLRRSIRACALAVAAFKVKARWRRQV